MHTQFRAYVLHNKGNIAPIYTTSVCKRQTKNFFLYLISYFFGSFIGLPSISLYPLSTPSSLCLLKNFKRSCKLKVQESFTRVCAAFVELLNRAWCNDATFIRLLTDYPLELELGPVTGPKGDTSVSGLRAQVSGSLSRVSYSLFHSLSLFFSLFFKLPPLNRN